MATQPVPPLEQHNREIALNRAYWDRKPLLRDVYHHFYLAIADALGTKDGDGVLEMGSGIGAIKAVLPKCQTSDIFPNPWLDRVESAYAINCGDGALSGLVLFDVWHHLEYPTVALREFSRALRPGGRVVLFEPAMGALGRLVYGAFHHEPLGLRKEIDWTVPEDKPPLRYYAAQGNAWRMFFHRAMPSHTATPLTLRDVRTYSALSYVASGGFSKPQLYPRALLPFMRGIEHLLDSAPRLFATRLLVVLERV